jgi:hypothetical protein
MRLQQRLVHATGGLTQSVVRVVHVIASRRHGDAGYQRAGALLSRIDDTHDVAGVAVWVAMRLVSGS